MSILVARRECIRLSILRVLDWNKEAIHCYETGESLQGKIFRRSVDRLKLA